MGLREETMDGPGRRVSNSPSIPRYGVGSPFKGHFSTKSNAFSTGSSGRLSDQYRIRDHMVVHYSKILSAKAAVDCSMPKSLTTSIKYSDQQRREKLRRDISRLEKEVLSLKNSRPSSGGSSRPVSAVLKKGLLGAQDIITVSPCEQNEHLYSARSYLSSPEQCLILPARDARESARKSINSSMSGLSLRSSSPRRPFHSSTCSSSDGSIPRYEGFHQFQDSSSKTYCGDLLERHSHHFTDNSQPFTPRMLKTQAKSVLSQYRYYTPPRRKRREGMKDAGTQTDISFLRRLAAPQKGDRKEPQRERQRTEFADTSSLSEMEEKLVLFQASKNRTEWNKLNSQQYSWPRFTSLNELKSPSPVMRKIKSEEEQLPYLEFVADVTNEILTLGLFSNRVLERVFERHVDENRHRLDESKMRHLLDGLRRDLGCPGESSANLNSGFLLRDTSKTRLTPDNETLSKGREKNDFRMRGVSSDHQKQIEQLLQKEIGGPVYGENILEEFVSEYQMQPQSVATDRGTDPLSSDREVDDPLSSDQDPLSSAQHKTRPDVLHTPEPLNASDCNSVLGDADESKELDDLERYFAESVRVSRDEYGSMPDLPEDPGADPSGTGHV